MRKKEEENAIVKENQAGARVAVWRKEAKGRKMDLGMRAPQK
jgi:hypothetical protein